MDLEAFPREPFDLRDAELRGLTRRHVWRAARAGILVRVGRGVYRRSDTVDSRDLRIQALARLGRHHIAVDRTAASIHGVDVHAFAERDVSPPLETCFLRGHRATRRRELRGRERDLSGTDVMMLDGLVVTTPLRTALDLGCHLRRREAFAAMCLLCRRHGLSSADLTREVRRFRRRRGVVQCRELAPLVEPRVESHREAWVLLEILDHGLPRPEPQWWIDVDGVPTFRLDFAYPAARICVEYDGEDAHDRTEDQRRHDRERRRWLRESGWTVIVVKRGDFTGADLDAWIQRLREALTPPYTTRRWDKW